MLSPFAQQKQFLLNNSQYRGRFAPSPSGPLHFGSLVAALGSYLQAKKNHGQWFVRIEDIDKPREQSGAVEQILSGLNAFGMSWDVDHNIPGSEQAAGCLVQTSRIKRYEEVLDYLIALNSVYACQCTRKQIKQLGGIYTGTCRDLKLPLADHSIRLTLPNLVKSFEDLLHGVISSPDQFNDEDFIVKRKDGLFAYQLVVVVDDIDQGITQIVRGADIMPLTSRQLSLYKLFDVPAPTYVHLPLASTTPGFKLSKQNHATAINQQSPHEEMIKAFEFLNLPVELLGIGDASNINLSPQQLIQWAVEHWRLEQLPKKQEILIPNV